MSNEKTINEIADMIYYEKIRKKISDMVAKSDIERMELLNLWAFKILMNANNYEEMFIKTGLMFYRIELGEESTLKLFDNYKLNQLMFLVKRGPVDNFSCVLKKIISKNQWVSGEPDNNKYLELAKTIIEKGYKLDWDEWVDEFMQYENGRKLIVILIKSNGVKDINEDNKKKVFKMLLEHGEVKIAKKLLKDAYIKDYFKKQYISDGIINAIISNPDENIVIENIRLVLEINPKLFEQKLGNKVILDLVIEEGKLKVVEYLVKNVFKTKIFERDSFRNNYKKYVSKNLLEIFGI